MRCGLLALTAGLWTTMASTGGADHDFFARAHMSHARSEVWRASAPFTALASMRSASAVGLAAAVHETKKSTKAAGSSLPLDDKAKHAVEFVEKQMKAHGIPGVGISVVYKRKVVINQGLGVTSVKTLQPVAPTTQFAIPEVSQTLLALGVAMLVKSHQVEWDDPVQMYLPEFALADSYAGSHTTIGDLFSMNSVIDWKDGIVGLSFGVHPNTTALIDALRHLNTTRPFRSGFAPNQLYLDIAGQVVEAVTGQTWHAFVLDAVAKPLHMKNTVGRPADAAPSQLTSAHFICNGSVAGPYPLANSTMTAIRPHDAYVAGASMVASINDLTKLSLALVGNPSPHDGDADHGYRSPESEAKEPAGPMTTGQSFNKMLGDVAPGLGLTYSPIGNSLAAGYGFDTVGDVMHGHHYFGVTGSRSTAGFVLAKGLGVVLTSNGIATGGKMSANFLLALIQSYLLGLYLDVPVDALDAQFAVGLRFWDRGIPAFGCDPHYFDNKPWDIPGVVIPDKTKHRLVGTYVADTSAGYYGNITVFIEPTGERNLMLQYGAHTHRLIAIGLESVFIWAIELHASTFHAYFANLDDPSPKLQFLMESFTRQ